MKNKTCDVRICDETQTLYLEFELHYQQKEKKGIFCSFDDEDPKKYDDIESAVWYALGRMGKPFVFWEIDSVKYDKEAADGFARTTNYLPTKDDLPREIIFPVMENGWRLKVDSEFGGCSICVKQDF